MREIAVLCYLFGVMDPPSYLYNPRVSPVSVSTTPFRVNAVKFSPSSTSSSPSRLLAIASHQDRVSSLQLRLLDTDVDVFTGAPDEGGEELGKERLGDCLANVDLLGDVQALCWLRPRLLAAAASTGHLHVLQEGQKAASLSLTHSLPVSPLSLNCVDVQTFSSPLVATAGDSSAISLFDVNSLKEVRTLPHASTSSTFDLRFSLHSLYSAHPNGTLRLFDVRSQSSVASLTVRHPSPHSLLALSIHPARPDTIATASAGGTVALWDLRRGGGQAPLSSYDTGAGAVNDLSFLPFDAATVVVGTEGGQVLLLDYNRERKDPTQVDYEGEVSALALHRSGGGVRSLDVDRTSHTIVAANDSQQLLHCQYLLS